MPANTSNRETVRDAFTSLLQTALVGAGLPVQAVYGYQVSDLQGQSPVVLVLSSGSARKRRGIGTEKFRSFHRLEVITLVIEADTDASWTDQNVEDRLDLIEKKIADVVGSNRSTANWEDVDFDGEFSSIEPAKVNSVDYKMEARALIFEVHDD